jgi:AcrR family transcriptional regulator
MTTAVERTERRRANGAGDTTRRRLIMTAERLFAERGIVGVSVRDITEEAGANTAAIHYHFGSKRGLIEAIIRFRAEEEAARRQRFLASVEADPRPTLDDVIGALVLPEAELVADTDWGRTYIAFMVAVAAHRDLVPLFLAGYAEHSRRYLRALARVTPHLDDGERVFRFVMAKDLVNRVLGQPDGPVRRWLEVLRPRAKPDVTTSLVRVVSGMFAAS